MSLEANWQEEKKNHKVGDNPVVSKDPGRIYKLYEELDGKGQFSFMRSPPCDGDPLDPFPFGWGFSRLDGMVKGEGGRGEPEVGSQSYVPSGCVDEFGFRRISPVDPG